jgi:hypothetical protein
MWLKGVIRGRQRVSKHSEQPWGDATLNATRRGRIQRELRVSPTGRPSRAAWPQSPPAMRLQRRVARPRETPRPRPLTRQTTRARRATARPVTPDWRADPRVGSPAKRPSYPSGKLPQPRRPTRTQPRPTYDAARQTHSPPERSITARSRPTDQCGTYAPRLVIAGQRGLDRGVRPGAPIERRSAVMRRHTPRAGAARGRQRSPPLTTPRRCEKGVVPPCQRRHPRLSCVRTVIARAGCTRAWLSTVVT